MEIIQILLKRLGILLAIELAISVIVMLVLLRFSLPQFIEIQIVVSMLATAIGCLMAMGADNLERDGMVGDGLGFLFGAQLCYLGIVTVLMSHGFLNKGSSSFSEEIDLLIRKPYRMNLFTHEKTQKSTKR